MTVGRVVLTGFVQRTHAIRRDATQRQRREALEEALPAETPVVGRDREALRYKVRSIELLDSSSGIITMSSVIASPALLQASAQRRLPPQYLELSDMRGIGNQVAIRMPTLHDPYTAVEEYARVIGASALHTPYLLCGNRLSYNLDCVARDAEEAPSSRLIAMIGDLAGDSDRMERVRISSQQFGFTGFRQRTTLADNMQALAMTEKRDCGIAYESGTQDPLQDYVTIFFDSLDDPRIEPAVTALSPERAPKAQFRRAIGALKMLCSYKPG